MRTQEAVERLIDVHDAVCADSVCAHQPAQLDERPVRIVVPTQTNKQGAMAARSARTSSSEENARSTDEEDHLLKKRCIERQWKNTI